MFAQAVCVSQQMAAEDMAMQGMFATERGKRLLLAKY